MFHGTGCQGSSLGAGCGACFGVGFGVTGTLAVLAFGRGCDAGTDIRGLGDDFVVALCLGEAEPVCRDGTHGRRTPSEGPI